MYWADRIAEEIISSGKYKPYWVDDMKTPSGRVHIGSVRAVITHDLIYKALRDQGVKATFSYVLEDHDPMDGLPIYLDQEEYKKHLGKPLYMIPSPEPGYKSYGERWGKEYIEIFNKVGCKPKIIWGSELYLTGKMNEAIELCLDSADKIRKIYKKLYKKILPDNWYPFNIICEKCGKISTTIVSAWDGEEVTYECKIDAVDWTQGCGQKGKISPFDGNGKLPWKVEWPCKWKVIGVTIEGAGKDHMSAGGSHDFAKLMCKNVLKYPVPYAFSHEFFLVGGKKMSSSKGLGSSAKEVSEIIPPYLIRFMIARVKFTKQISFDPKGATIPDLFDDYDRCAKSFWGKEGTDRARIFEVSQIGKPPEEIELARFRDVANYLNLGIGPKAKFKNSVYLDERVKYAKIWLEKYATPEYKMSLVTSQSQSSLNLSDKQKLFLSKLVGLIEKEKDVDRLQTSLYNLAKELGLPSKEAFGGIYKVLLGKDHGPKAAWLIMSEKDKVKERLQSL